ncbi:MAG: DUF4339 domain-containing protein [Pyrinomonadaceae bacterium]
MTIYIHKNNQQLGPYEDDVVLDKLRSGDLSPDDLAITQGGQWQPLRTMFPQVTRADAPAPVKFAAPAPVPVAAAVSSEPEPQYRATTLLKVFFGLCFLGAAAILAATVYYIFTFGSSGDLEADLSRMGFRDLGKYLAIGTFVGGFFMFLAFLISFKRKLIRSNGARIALRVFFVLVLLAGFGTLAFGAFSYLNYSAPTPTKASESNELLRALEAGSEVTGRYETAAIALPIGAGLFLLGVSGMLMAKRARD